VPARAAGASTTGSTPSGAPGDVAAPVSASPATPDGAHALTGAAASTPTAPVPREASATATARGAAGAGTGSGALAQAGAATTGAETGSVAAAPGAQAQAGGSANASAGGPTLATGVGMQEMIDSIRATIEIAARQGVTQARIALEPEDLGHISIRLSQTSDGLLARVSADTPAAVQALAEGRSELHQSLSSLGVSLLRLDISSFGQPQAGSREDRSAGNPDGTSTAGPAQDSEAADDAATGALDGAGAPAPIAGGELVDVLA
jgi:flagellar hook-length control protein FliK